MRRPAIATIILAALSPLAPAGQGPQLDTRNVRLKLVDGKLTGSLEYTLVVGTYHEWNTDPTAVPGLMSEVTSRTGIRATVNFSPIGLDEGRIRRNPLVIMTGNRYFNLSKTEIANLRRYLQAGGFLYTDDCGGADRSFRIMIKKLLPASELVELGASHPIFNCFYKLPGTPKIIDLYGGKAKGYAAYLGDRLAVFYTYDTDVPCGWEKNPDGSFVHLLSKTKHEQSYRLGVNVVMYVLKELCNRRLAASPAPSTRPAGRAAETGAFLAGPLRTYRMRPRMPCNLIRAIAPAGRYVWVAGRRMLPGEQEGLGRFDYQTGAWELFLDSEGVLADEVNCLAVGPGGLWIGTSTIRRRWNHGLWRYDPESKRSRRYTKADGLVDHDVYDLAADGEDLYVATRSGLGWLEGKSGKWHRDPTHSRTYLDLTLCLAVDDRHVWAGRANGLRRYHKQKGTYENFDARNSPVSGMVNALAIDGDRLWISAPPQLITYSKGSFAIPPEGRPIAAAEVLAAAGDDKLLCFGTRAAGLHVLEKATGRWRVFDKAAGLPAQAISKVALDARSIWCAFGENPLGVGRCDRGSGKWTFYSYRAGVPCDHVFCLTCDGDDLFVGTMSNGFWKYLCRADRWINLNLAHRAEHAPVRRTDVYCTLHHKNALWFGTNRGLCRHRMGSDTYEILAGPTAAVAALAADGETILCGTQQRGLMAYAPDARTWADLNRRYGIEPSPVTAIACDAGQICLGTDRGLLLLDKASARPKSVPPGLASQPVTALLLREGTLLVGTRHGLLRYDTRTGRQRELLAGAHVTALLARPGGGLLVGTRSGLALLADPATPRVAVFDKRLAGQHVSALACGADHLWIGTVGHGLVRAGRHARAQTPKDPPQ